MNSIRQISLLNKRELESTPPVPPSASWHADYRDTAWIYIGGLPFDYSEGDVLTIFSQFGTPTHINLVRDKETGKSKGFSFLKYEDQRSCDLAVDNLSGAEVGGDGRGNGVRVLNVDHTRYKRREGEDEETYRVDKLEVEEDDGRNGNGKRGSDTDDGGSPRRKKRRPMLKEEEELEKLMRVKEGEEDDPMREFLIKEKKEEIENALARIEKKDKKHRHRHRDRGGEDGGRQKSRRHHDSEDDGSRHRSRRDRDQDDAKHSRHRSHRHYDSDDRERSHRRDRERGDENSDRYR